MDSRQVTDSPAIVIATLNAKYIHASLGLRCLTANMNLHGGAGLRARTALREFTVGQRRRLERQDRPPWIRSCSEKAVSGNHNKR